MTTKILVNNIERKLFWLLAGFLGVAVLLYFYSVVSLTTSVVARDRAVSSAREKVASASGLEREYILLQNSITFTRAQELGFNEVHAKFTSESQNKFSLMIR